MAVKFDWSKYSKGKGELPGMNIWKSIIKKEEGVTRRAIQEMEKKMAMIEGIETGAQGAAQEVARGIAQIAPFVIKDEKNRIVSMANNEYEVADMLKRYHVPAKNITPEAYEKSAVTIVPGEKGKYKVYNQGLRGKLVKSLKIGDIPHLREIVTPIELTSQLDTGLRYATSTESTPIGPGTEYIVELSEGEGGGGKEEMEEMEEMEKKKEKKEEGKAHPKRSFKQLPFGPDPDYTYSYNEKNIPDRRYILFYKKRIKAIGYAPSEEKLEEKRENYKEYLRVTSQQ